MASDGHGTTIAFGTSTFTANLIDVSGPGISRAPIDTSHMGTATAMTAIPASLYDGGEVTITVEHAGDDAPPITAAAEVITINWAGSGETWVFNAFVSGYEPGASIGERMQATMNLKVSGVVTET